MQFLSALLFGKAAGNKAGQAVDEQHQDQQHHGSAVGFTDMQALVGKQIHMGGKGTGGAEHAGGHGGNGAGRVDRAAVSPTMRPVAKITPDKMPGMALGSTMVNTVRSLPAPRPKLPSR